MLRLFLIGLLLAGLPGGAVAQGCAARRCEAAQHAVEAAIAADPWLALMDRARRMRLDELAAPLGPEAAAELRRQDAAWRRSLVRDLRFHADGTLDEPDPRAALRGPLESRLMLMIRIDPLPGPAFTGRWAGLQGEVTVRAQGSGYDIDISTADLGGSGWSCDYAGHGRAGHFPLLEAEDGAVALHWLGGMLQVEQRAEDEAETDASFCGAGGRVDGLYFRVGEAE